MSRVTARSPQPGLNAGQRQAVETLSGPLLVLAGAGTGKTRVVTLRIVNLIRHGVPADRILAVTFTNKAAKEMRERIGALLSKKKDAPRPAISTFHAQCVQILRRHITKLGYPGRFFIAARDDQESFARTALREVRATDQVLAPSDLLWQIGQWKSKLIGPRAAASVADSDKQHLAAAAYRRYQQALKQAGGVDFDDLLSLSEQLFREFPECREQEAGRWDHLLIDEYQDTNTQQYEIVKHLAAGHRNLCVVGDDDQSIYGWRGAEVQHILNFRRDWPECRVVRLEENYRSTSEILAFANRLIAFNRQRHDKQLRTSRNGGPPPRLLQLADENKEAAEVVREIQKLLREPGVCGGDIAILCRTNEQPRPFEAELRKAKVPYVLIGSQSFFDRKEIKDILAYLRMVANPEDDLAIRRIINTPPRGLGKNTVKRLSDLSLQSGRSMWELLAAPVADWPGAAKKGASDLRAAIESCQVAAQQGNLVDAVTRMLDQLRYRHLEIERNYPNVDDREARWSSVEQLINSLAAYVQDRGSSAQLGEFIDQVMLADKEFDNEKQEQLSRHAVALMTLHSAKGLEFPFVFMVGMEEGILPHHRSLSDEQQTVDEERRLCYVGVTRARQQLTLSMALTRMKWGKPRDSLPSRFLYEMTGKTEHPNYQQTVGQ